MIELPFDLPDFEDLGIDSDLDIEPADTFDPATALTGSSPVNAIPGLPAGLADWLSIEDADDAAEFSGLSHAAVSEDAAAAELGRRLAAESKAASVLAAQGQRLPWL